MKTEQIVKIRVMDDTYKHKFCEIDYYHSSKLFLVKFSWNIAEMCICAECLREMIAELKKMGLTQ